MPQRLAAVMSLLAFAVCLVIGGVGADNPFTTTVERALAAMSGPFVVALVAGRVWIVEQRECIAV
jgi:hypothetical protein